MNYTDLTIHQRISMKGVIAEKRERYFLSHRINTEDMYKNRDKYFDGLKALWLLFNFKFAVEFFFDRDTPMPE